jgi:hypothetical protein
MNKPTNAATADITAAFALAAAKEQIVRQTILHLIAPNQFLHEDGGLGSVETRMLDGDGIEVAFHAPYGEMRPLRHILDELFAAADAASRLRDDEDWGEGGG